MQILVCVVKPEAGKSKVKETPSSEGMAISLETSDLMINGRIRNDLPQQHIEDIERALNEKSFKKLAKIIIRESNQLHAICLDTYPPI
jgi:diphosphomevalonate decarboxylase